MILRHYISQARTNVVSGNSGRQNVSPPNRLYSNKTISTSFSVFQRMLGAAPKLDFLWKRQNIIVCLQWESFQQSGPHETRNQKLSRTAPNKVAHTCTLQSTSSHSDKNTKSMRSRIYGNGSKSAKHFFLSRQCTFNKSPWIYTFSLVHDSNLDPGQLPPAQSRRRWSLAPVNLERIADATVDFPIVQNSRRT